MLGEGYGRDPLTHEEFEALDLKAVTEEVGELPAEQMRHEIFRFGNPDVASSYVAREIETTSSPTVLYYLKHA